MEEKAGKKFVPGFPDDAVQDYEKESRKAALEVAEGGMVLLENDGTLPLQKGAKVALFGRGAVVTEKGGTGSGDVNSRSVPSLWEGLEQAGVTVANREMLAQYRDRYQKAKEAWRSLVWEQAKEGNSESDPFMGFIRAFEAHPFQAPAFPKAQSKEADVAFYVLSRISGEGRDREAEKGDYYLSDAEEEELAQVCRLYPKVVLVLNVGGIVDLSFLDRYSNIGAVLLVSQAGICGGQAFADLVTGTATPSGKLTDTWALHYEDYPDSSVFSANDGKVDVEPYMEGIYVGYRYFDTFEKPVRYCFGHGLSYTSFGIEALGLELEGRGTRAPQLHASFKVTNTGTIYSGREVVQVYVSAPQPKEDVDMISDANGQKASAPQPEEGREYRKLAGYAKTKILQPGESQKVEVTVPLRAFCRYSQQEAAWILDGGEYLLFAGSSLDATKVFGIVHVQESMEAQRGKRLWTEELPFQELSAPAARVEQRRKEALAAFQASCETGKPAGPQEQAETAGRQDPAGQQEAGGLQSPAESRNMVGAEDPLASQNNPVFLEILPGDLSCEWMDYEKEDAFAGEKAKEIAASLSKEQLARFCCGEIRGLGEANAIGSAGSMVPGSAAQTSGCAREQGVPVAVLADGPAGLRLTRAFCENPEEEGQDAELRGMFGEFLFPPKQAEGTRLRYQNSTAFPIGTLLAQCWDPEAARKMGQAVGKEMQALGVDVWLAPGMNIHRDPLCGRNFEYYSEDPLLSGRTAARIAEGVQSHDGCSVTIKHLACNSQEENRMGYDAQVSERALREIYLKGFEIAVKEGHSRCIMTSYNKVNGTHSANNRQLCTDMARHEWGFEGVIMTDWTTTMHGPDCTAEECVKAGNDLVMPGAPSDLENLQDALDQGRLSMEQLRESAARVIQLAISCGGK